MLIKKAQEETLGLFFACKKNKNRKRWAYYEKFDFKIGVSA